MLRGTAIVGALTLLSRVLGFVRDLLVARLLGASPVADAFFVAFRIPNLLRSFVAEGALTSAFIPVFSHSLASSRDAAAATFRKVLGFLLSLTIPITCLGIVFAPTVVHLFAPGFSDNSTQFTLAVYLTQLMMPYILCVSVIALLNSALNALGIYGASAWAQVIMNLVLIAGALVALPLNQEGAAIVLAISVLIGGAAQIISQVPASRRADISLRPSLPGPSREVKEVCRLMLPATVGASVYQLTIFVATVLASLLQEGSVSWLFYADRVAQFPIGIFSVALASVLLPTLSNASAASDSEKFKTSLGNSLRYTSFCVLPMAAGIWTLALPITQLLFERGNFSYESSVRTAQALQALALGLWFSSCHSMIVRAFIAKKDTATPTVIGIVSLLVNFSVSLLLMGPISQGAPGQLAGWARALQEPLLQSFPYVPALGHVGLALASSTAALVSLVLVATIASIRIARLPFNTFIPATIRALVASLLMVLGIEWIKGYGFGAATTCSIGISLGIVIYCLSSAALRSPEMNETLRLTKRLRRSSAA